MNMPTRTIQDLFSQLGLASNEKQIHAFIGQHRPLAPEINLSEAQFWNKEQAVFLKQALAEDADWCIVVDQLNSYLRKQGSWMD